jgi:hypothetical protein
MEKFPEAIPRKKQLFCFVICFGIVWLFPSFPDSFLSVLFGFFLFSLYPKMQYPSDKVPFP